MKKIGKTKESVQPLVSSNNKKGTIDHPWSEFEEWGGKSWFTPTKQLTKQEEKRGNRNKHRTANSTTDSTTDSTNN